MRRIRGRRLEPVPYDIMELEKGDSETGDLTFSPEELVCAWRGDIVAAWVIDPGDWGMVY